MSRRHGSPRLRLATVATALLVGFGAAACGDSGSDASTPADSAGATDPLALQRATDWLVGNLNADDLLEVTTSWEGETSTTVDAGSSIDLVLGLSATGQQPETAAAVTDAVAEGLDAYVGSDGEVYSGPSAKALVLAVDQERDPRSFGGVDLQARVEDAVATEGAIAGRLQDTSEFGDYANSIGQAYAAAGLTRTGSERAEAVTGFLLDQQCSDGFFRLDFSDRGASDQGCDGDDSISPEQAPDTTALVVVQLAGLAADADVAAAGVDEALDRAGAWLLAQQADDGSFSDPQNGTNANTTGLAGWALAELGEDEAAAEAAQWLRDLQVVDEEGELADETGAIAYDEASLAEAREHGLADPLDRSPWVVAGVQAFPALVAAPSVDEREGEREDEDGA